MMAELRDLHPWETVEAGGWACWHCWTLLGVVHVDNGALTVQRAAVRFVEVNNRGLLMVQCDGCSRWSQWWQGAPHVTPTLEAAE